MRSPLLRPRWLGIHALALLTVLCCLVFGYWQFESAKEPDRDAVPRPEKSASAADITTVSDPGAPLPRSKANQAVSATGVYDGTHQLLAPGESADGDQGFYVVSPLVLDDGSAVAVNRGWLPGDTVDTADDALPPVPEERVTVTGWLTPPQEEAHEGFTRIATPEGRVERIAPAILVNEWPYRLYEGYITLAERPPAAASASGELRVAPPMETPESYTWNWRNVSYAAQWAVFGLAAGGFWIALVRREMDDGAAAAEPRQRPGDHDSEEATAEVE